MKHYMIDITLPQYYDEGFNEKVPEQIEMIDDLMEEELIVSWSLSLDQSKAWIIAVGDSEEEIVDLLVDFPLLSYFKYSIHQLSLFNTFKNTDIPPFSLN
ncbi:hypothetical protein RCC89_07485 [Cytophagaceae bacterium ABcell3]|nr:hypothetical protein RCC89_07485 [Cytophagaceae bacterium ABcell3]